MLLGSVLLLAALLTAGGTPVRAQSKPRPADSPEQRQLHQALTLAAHGDEQGAMTAVQRLIKQHPHFAQAIKLKGMLLEQAGRPAEAAAAYQAALKFAPNDGDLLLEVGTYRLSTGQNEEALKLLQHCVKVIPRDADAQFYLAQAYHLNGHDDLALAAIQQSLKFDPDNTAAWQKYGELLCGTDHCEDALPWLQKAQHKDATLPHIDYDIALTDFKLMDLASAAQYAARAVESQPSDLPALQLLADADTKLAKWQDGKHAWERVLASKPDDLDSLIGLGQCELELKDYPAAADNLQAAIRLNPTRPLTYFYLSRVYAGMGKTADAEHEAALHHLMMEQLTFGRDIENDQREAPIKAPASKLLAEHREEDALLLYRTRFHGTPATPADAYVFIGKLYLFAGDDKDALRSLHHALELQPPVRGAHTYLGILALKQGDLAGAENDFKAELANDPNYQLAIAELGELRYRQGRWSEAAEQLANSRTMNPELLYMLSDSYFRTGKISDANLTAETAAAYGRNNRDFLKQLNDLLLRNGQADLAQRLSVNLTQK
ncbi:MAG: tetratricopeptide repeat protein [Terriglobales bacterium]